MPSLVWDLFCRVVDNHGDLGVCLRLARQLTGRGQTVRLWVDDSSALQWMATAPQEQAWARPWPEGTWNVTQAGDVVIEAFGCHLPACVEHQLALRPPRAWINLEYLSAEAWVTRSHGLDSPVMQGPARGLTKRFCFPGFSGQTGGLLRPEATGLANGQLPEALARALEPAQQCGGTEQVVSLFCYPHAPLAALFQRLCGHPCQVLVLGGADLLKRCHQARAELMPAQATNIRLLGVPWLNQAQYDTLLAQCDLNIVRGEDSLMRAQWAGRPFLWHIYRQDDGVHADKLDAFLDTWLPPGAGHAAWRQAWLAWNGLLPAAVLAHSHHDGLGPEGASHAQQWRKQLLALPDLVGVLQHWALGHPGPTFVDR